VWNPNREFMSQGVASVAAGLGGGYTAGASFSCSALNREAGARTSWSQAVTGIVCLAFLPATELLARLPTATLAGITVLASTTLVKPRVFVQYRRYARVQWSVAVLTFVLTLAFAPHIERAVVAGVVLAVAAHLWREMRISVPSWRAEGALHVRPKGVLYFASAPGLEREVERLLAQHPEATCLVVHLDGLGRIDLSGALVLRDLLAGVRAGGREVVVSDVPPQAKKIVARVLLIEDE
jgi:SulP family sulfate permease